MWVALAMASAVGQAADDAADAAEEVVVYGDDFARWDHTRWLVLNELWFPFGATFATERSKAFESFAFQIRAVILCDKDAKLAKRRWEVSCIIEDVGVQATSMRRWRHERDRALVQDVLDEIDAKLTGTDVQMQVADDGGVMNVDLEGITATNARNIEIAESLRQITARMMAGFHLRIPEHAQRSGQWMEYRSELMDLPSLTSSRGNTVMVHLVSPVEGWQIVQTVGEGSVAVAIPVAQLDAFSQASSPAGLTGGLAGPGSTPDDRASGEASTSALTGSKRESSIEATYKMDATGVAVFRKADGIMTERVWTVTGMPTAGSAGGTTSQPPPFRNLGRIQQLGETDRPDVGPTRQVAWPGKEMEGLPAWVSIETAPSPGPG